MYRKTVRWIDMAKEVLARDWVLSGTGVTPPIFPANLRG